MMDNNNINNIYQEIKDIKKEEQNNKELEEIKIGYELELYLENSLKKYRNNVVTFGMFETAKFNTNIIKKTCKFRYYLVNKIGKKELLNGFLVVKPNLIQTLILLFFTNKIITHILSFLIVFLIQNKIYKSSDSIQLFFSIICIVILLLNLKLHNLDVEKVLKFIEKNGEI